MSSKGKTVRRRASLGSVARNAVAAPAIAPRAASLTWAKAGTRSAQAAVGHRRPVQQAAAADRATHPQAYLTVQPYARVTGVFTGWPAATDCSASRT